MNVKIEVFNADDMFHQQAANRVSDWSLRADTVLTVQPEEVAGYPYSIFALNEFGVALGHVAVVNYENNVATIGRFIVSTYFREIGIGGLMLGYLTETLGENFPDMEKCLVYSTYESTRFFEKAGGVFAGFRNPILPGRANWITDLMPAIK